jgi:molybdopterin/thiamine biosynthesis adenylyltransferase
LDDPQLLRYSRQIMLPPVGYEGQQRLLESTVVVIGMGGLGAPAAMYLAAAGVGNLVIADFDRVDLSNLQRQIIHTTDRIGQHKVESARETLRALNPDTRVVTIDHRPEDSELRELARNADVLLDASDNFATRFALNRASVATGTPLVSGAAVRFEGQVSVFAGRHGGPCYRCLYEEQGAMDESCSENGVLAPVVGVVGSIQALEAIKLLVGCGQTLAGRLLLFDGFAQQWRSLRLSADPECPVCGTARQPSG